MIRRLALLAAAAVLALVAASAQAAGPIQPGDPFPAFNLKRPASEAQAQYLGLPAGQASFTLDQVKAPLVLIEVFSMYCTICQGEARRVNQLYELSRQGPQAGKLKVIGIGAGNSAFEVEVFRKKYHIPLPLFPDGNYKLHQAFKEPRTPYFMLLHIRPGTAPAIIYTHLGPFGQPEEFFRLLLSKAPSP